MRKITIALLAIIYLTISSGVAMTIHYCMGKIASVGLMHTGDKCGKCGMKTTGGCCKDEFRMVKISDSHNLINNEIIIYSPVAVIDHSNSTFDTTLFSSDIKSDYNNHSPPDSSDTSLNILHCVFRI